MYGLFPPGAFDPAELVTTAFVMFFFGLILYLRREDRREGYPLEDPISGRLDPLPDGVFFRPRPKTFLLPHDEGTHTVPNDVRDSETLNGVPSTAAPDSPLDPVGDPMLAGIGPGSYAQRAKRPDVTLHGLPKIVPLRVAEGFFVDTEGANPIGMKVVGADGVAAGVVSDVWIDRAEYMIRYLEVELTGSAKKVLVPMPMLVVSRAKNAVQVNAILGSQFVKAPTLENPDQITFDEEERVVAFYGGGLLYATAARMEARV
jgi:photosynthetic reaction center H subunit